MHYGTKLHRFNRPGRYVKHLPHIVLLSGRRRFFYKRILSKTEKYALEQMNKAYNHWATDTLKTYKSMLLPFEKYKPEAPMLFPVEDELDSALKSLYNASIFKETDKIVVIDRQNLPETTKKPFDRENFKQFVEKLISDVKPKLLK